MISTASEMENTQVQCQVRDGVVTIDGQGWGYYTSRNGVQMLVVEWIAKQRLRINDAIEVTVLEIDNGNVRLSVERIADTEEDPAGC